MTEKKTKTSKAKNVTDEKSGKDPDIHKSFIINWENVIRIIGSLTGIAGISTALLFLFGYFHYAGMLDAMSLSADSFISIPNNYYLLNGISPFISFIAYTIGILFFYYLAQKVAHLVEYNIIKHINRSWLSKALPFVVGIISIISGGIVADRGGGISMIPLNIIGVFFILLGIEIILIPFESFQTKDNTHQAQHSYFDVFNLTLSTIKTAVVAFIILFSIMGEGANALIVSRSSTCKDIIDSPTSVVIFSDNPMPMDGELNEETFAYDGYYLLFIDNENYYLYRDVNLQTLKPKSVYIIKKNSLTAIELKSVSAPAEWQHLNRC